MRICDQSGASSGISTATKTLTRRSLASTSDEIKRTESARRIYPRSASYAEHIVHARGKRTRYTSVSLDLTKIKDFGDADYRLERQKLRS